MQDDIESVSDDLPVLATDGYRVQVTVRSDAREEVSVFNRKAAVLEVEFESDAIVVTPQPTRFTFESRSFRVSKELLSVGIPRYPERSNVVDPGGKVVVCREDSVTDTVVVAVDDVRIPIASFDFVGDGKTEVLMRCPAGVGDVPQVFEVEI